MITPVRSDGQREEEIHVVKGKQEVDVETHRVFESLPPTDISQKISLINSIIKIFFSFLKQDIFYIMLDIK